VDGAFLSDPKNPNSRATYPRLVSYDKPSDAAQTDIVSNPTKARQSLDYIVQTINQGLPAMVGVNEAGHANTINEGVTDHFLPVYGYDMQFKNGEWKVTTLYGLDNAAGNYSAQPNERVRQYLAAASRPVFQVQDDFKMTKAGGVGRDLAVANAYQITQVRFYEKDFEMAKRLDAYYGPATLKRK
jgi:hypothetical protein